MYFALSNRKRKRRKKKRNTQVDSNKEVNGVVDEIRKTKDKPQR